MLEDYKKRLSSVLRTREYRECEVETERRKIIEDLTCPNESIELFQYRPCTEECIKALEKGTILFKSPLRFNDPFDSMMYWDNSKVDRYFGDEKYKKVLEKFCLWDAECVAHNISNCFRISCFSETCYSPLMWAHYAKNCTGYCVGYELHPSFGNLIDVSEVDSVEKCECSVFPVMYSDRRIDATDALIREIEYMVAHENNTINQLPLDAYDKLEPYKTTLFKSNNWAYEREWRVIISNFTANRTVDYLWQNKSITRVIFGPKMSPSNMMGLIDAMHKYVHYANHPIKLQKVEVNWQSEDYTFEIKDWGTLSVPPWESKDA